MKKHEYKRLFRKVVGVNPTRSLKRKISYQALVAEEAFEASECDSVQHRFIGEALVHPPVTSHLLPSGQSRTPFKDAISEIFRGSSLDTGIFGGGNA